MTTSYALRMELFPELLGPTKTTMSSSSKVTGSLPIARKFFTVSLCNLGRGTDAIPSSISATAAVFFRCHKILVSIG